MSFVALWFLIFSHLKFHFRFNKLLFKQIFILLHFRMLSNKILCPSTEMIMISVGFVCSYVNCQQRANALKQYAVCCKPLKLTVENQFFDSFLALQPIVLYYSGQFFSFSFVRIFFDSVHNYINNAKNRFKIVFRLCDDEFVR